MSMYQQFKTDPQVEKDGVWLDYGDFRIRIARAGGANKKFQKVTERLTRPYRRALATGTIDPDVAEGLLMQAYAEAVVREWEVFRHDEWVPGIEGPDGDILEVTTENIVATFQALRSTLYEDVKEQATSWALFKADITEEAAGN